RTGLELLYHAVPAPARDRARPIIDGAVTRLAQAGAAGLVLFLATRGLATPRALTFVAMCSAILWAAATAPLRGPYIALLRRARLGEEAEGPRSPEELDLANVELLIEALSGRRARDVVAAMDALARRGRSGLVPALLLLRKEEEVLERALELFSSSTR